MGVENLTTITYNISDERFAFIKKQVRQGRYKDFDDYFDSLIDSDKKLDLIIIHTDENTQGYLSRGEKPPIPYANSTEEVEALLDEAEESEESPFIDEDWGELRRRAQVRYERLQK